MTDPFRIRVEGDARLVVHGELDLATAPQLTAAIDAAQAAGGQRVLVDLAGVSFLDSSGISALCLALRRLAEHGAVLVLGPLSQQAETALRIVGLEGQFVVESGAS
jgi:anti-anti-sigma factor